MEVSNLSLNEIIDIFFNKIKELLNLTDFTQIDIKNITSTILLTLTVTLIVFFTLWLLRAIGLYKMARKKGDKYAFLAFIPYFCLYTQGKIIGKTTLFGIRVEHTELILPLLIISCMLPFSKPISLILLLTCYLATLYKIYKLKSPSFATILLLLSIILPIVQPFILFFIRNKEDVK